MTRSQSDLLDTFEDVVELKFRLYNSLFLSLPFHGIEKTGALLTLFGQECESGYENKVTAPDIVSRFFEQNTVYADEKERLDVLFRFVQYAEREVVLFDAIEDASFGRLHEMRGIGTLPHLVKAALRAGRTPELRDRLQDFGIRLVLTAHPTQFYPGAVLGIINDLSDAIDKGESSEVKLLLQQLGRTPFFKKEKPTPFDEAQALIWYLENVFYQAIGEIVSELRKSFPSQDPDSAGLIRMGFWSGGDRDGNPFVRVGTTRQTALALRKAVLRCYHADMRLLRRRLTFAGVGELVEKLERKVYEDAFLDTTSLTADAILGSLEEILVVIVERHNGLFGHMVADLITKVRMFGLSIASLDIRQDSSVHTAVCGQLADSGILPSDYESLGEIEKIAALLNLSADVDPSSLADELAADTIATIKEIGEIQRLNGNGACHRYIISHAQNAVDVFEVYGLFLASGWTHDHLPVDIVPLFETVDDLENSADVMRTLYSNSRYRGHLEHRENKQTVMVGFSDGTKDGGYLMANYGIYAAKRALTEVSREFGIEVIFFDGRGGPPARGGGKTHRFYASMGSEIENKAIEVTVQGQTVSSNFGTVDSARYNIEQLLHAGGYGPSIGEVKETFNPNQEKLLRDLALSSFKSYTELKTDPEFLNYLEFATPLRFYARANIGSRPSKRGGPDAKMTLESLRAIPFVGAWSQMKQNVPGFYGVGTALSEAADDGSLSAIAAMYKENAFFKALIDNCEMAMQKTFLPLTAHLENDREFGNVWKRIRDEYERCREFLAVVTDNPSFMTDFPVAQQSVQLRERIVLPLTTIQQYALERIRSGDSNLEASYEKLIVRCSFGIINAGRNSA